MSDLTGSQLKQIRLDRGIALEQVANATRIQLTILQHLENDDYNLIASKTQARGFLKLYSDFLLGGKKIPPLVTGSLSESTEPTKDILIEEPVVEQMEKTLSPTKKENKRLVIKRRKSNTQRSQTSDKKQKEEAKVDLSVSQQLLIGIGRDLTGRRRYLNIPWDLIVEQTKIKKSQLQALERGDLDPFSSTMEAKGHLQTYSRFLNLDTDMILIRYGDALQQRRLELNRPKIRKKNSGKLIPPLLLSLRRFFTLDLFFGSLLVLGILAFLIWGILTTSRNTNKFGAVTELPQVIDVLMYTQTPEPSPTAVDATPTLNLVLIPTATTFIFPIDSADPVQVVVLAKQSVWIRVLSDEDQVFQGRLKEGDIKSFTGSESVILESGNFAGIKLLWNGVEQILPFSIGGNGSVSMTADYVEMQTSSGIILSTPTIVTSSPSLITPGN